MSASLATYETDRYCFCCQSKPNRKCTLKTNKYDFYIFLLASLPFFLNFYIGTKFSSAITQNRRQIDNVGGWGVDLVASFKIWSHAENTSVLFPFCQFKCRSWSSHVACGVAVVSKWTRTFSRTILCSPNALICQNRLVQTVHHCNYGKTFVYYTCSYVHIPNLVSSWISICSVNYQLFKLVRKVSL